MLKTYTAGVFWIATATQLERIKFDTCRFMFMGWPEDEAFDLAVVEFLTA